MYPDPGEVTVLLQQLREGAAGAEERLIGVVYRELRRLAASYLRREDANHTLQPTALVHEVYLRLIRLDGTDWQGRCHFFAVAARLMRNILVDHARAYQAHKRGRAFTVVGLDEAFAASPERAPEILALDEALDRLAAMDARKSRVVELRFFSGMNEEEVGHVLGISPRTVKRDWQFARAWLFRELSSEKAIPLSSDH